MNKEIKNVNISQLKHSHIKIEFNNQYSYVLEKKDVFELNMTKNEDEMLEAFPGIFITKKCLFRFIPIKVVIHICNFRDEVKISLFENNLLIKDVYKSEGSRKISLIPCSNEDLALKKISLESIHFPENETGGGTDRCYLKGLLKGKRLYPDFCSLSYCNNKYSESYQLFTYEEIFQLPDYVSELRCECWKFCSKRNMGNSEYNVVNGNKLAIDKLVNKHFSGAVRLELNDDCTLSITNGNHRICFMKHFQKELSLDKIYFENIYIDRNLQKDSIKVPGFRNYSRENKMLDVDSYYEQLKNFGVSKKEARKILLEGFDNIELYNYLKNKDFNNHNDSRKWYKKDYL